MDRYKNDRNNKCAGKRNKQIPENHETGLNVLTDWRSRVRTDLLLESAMLQSSGMQEGTTHDKRLSDKEPQGENRSDKKLQGEELPVWEYEKNGLQVTEIRIETAEQEKRLNRKKGRYVTIYSDNLKVDDGGIHQEAVNETASWIRRLLPEGVRTVFVVGLGNQEASVDALGPDTVSHVAVNRHMEKNETSSQVQICAMSPGVMAQTGLETAGILEGITGKFKPDALLVIDALAARSVTRLGTTIQLTDAGIAPGAGVGNHRQEISRAVLGIPVIAIGIPMVVEAAAIIYETIDAIRYALRQENMENEAGFLKQMSMQEQYDLFRELLEKKARPLYVTVKDVDEMEKRLSFTLSEAINRALSGMNSA